MFNSIEQFERLAEAAVLGSLAVLLVLLVCFVLAMVVKELSK